MSHYALYDAQGVIRQTASGAAPPTGAGLTVLTLDTPIDPREWHVAGGVLVAGLQDLRTEEKAWRDVRRQRDELLTSCDWITVRAIERAEPVPTAWATYRQALRDITEQTDPFNITWPTPPLGA